MAVGGEATCGGRLAASPANRPVNPASDRCAGLDRDRKHWLIDGAVMRRGARARAPRRCASADRHRAVP